MKLSEPVRHFDQFFWAGCDHVIGHVSVNDQKRIRFFLVLSYSIILQFYGLIFSYLLEIILTVL